MTLSDDLRDYLDYIVETVKATMPVSAIYLFGSYAKGTYNKHSDLDLFVVTPDTTKREIEWMDDLHGAIDRSLGIPIEILVNDDVSFEERSKGFYTIEREIVDTGVKIYDSRR